MDKSISYEDAVGAVESSVLSFDISNLRSALQRFPVLQIFAAQRLISKLAALENADALGEIAPVTECIGCIVSPRDSVTAECRICATNMFYAIRDRDDCVLRAILKRMIATKRSCEGCGLFVHIVSSESLKQRGLLGSFIADQLNKDEARRCNTHTHFWKQVLDLLEKERLLNASDRSSVPTLRNTSSRKDETRKMRRLFLKTKRSKKWRKRQRHNISASSNIKKCFDGNHNERSTLFKLAALHAVYPDFIARKLDAYHLKSYCAARVHALCDFISSSQQQVVTPGDLFGMKSFANMLSDPSYAQTYAICRNGLNNGFVLSSREANDVFAICKHGMPLDVGIRNTVWKVLSGQVLLDTVLDGWMAAKGNMCPSVDQLVVAVLSDDEAFRKLTTHYLYSWRTANSANDVNSVMATHRAAPFHQVNGCLRCLEPALERGIGYPSAFWNQTAHVFQRLTDVVVWGLVHEVQDACKEDMNEVITRSRRVEKRLQGHIEYRHIEPRKDCASLKICDCWSLEMRWKHRRRWRFTAWRECRCMIPNTVFVRVPHPDLWFSWISACNAKNDSTSNVEDSDSSCSSASVWLYGNSALRGAQHKYSEREILRCIIENALQDEREGVIYETEDVLAHVLQDSEARENVFSEIATSTKKLTSEAKCVPDKKSLDARRRLLRKGIERLWKSAYQKSKSSDLLHETGMLTRTPSTEIRSIESLLALLAPCSSGIHDCIREMPTLCEYITLLHRHAALNDGEVSMHIKIIAGLLSPSIHGKSSLRRGRLPQQDAIFESVMHCFE